MTDVTETRTTAASPMNLREMVAYQPGSIVSRMLINTSSGTVTLFAFDTEEELSEHSAPYDALLILLEGDAEIRVGGEPHRMSGDQAIVLPARVPHAVKALTQFKMMLVMIHD